MYSPRSSHLIGRVVGIAAALVLMPSGLATAQTCQPPSAESTFEKILQDLATADLLAYDCIDRRYRPSGGRSPEIQSAHIADVAVPGEAPQGEGDAATLPGDPGPPSTIGRQIALAALSVSALGTAVVTAASRRRQGRGLL